MAISTRFRALSLRIRLARWVLTVLMLMFMSSAISWFVHPLATGIRISSSRLVSGSRGSAAGDPPVFPAKAVRSRAVMLGAISASPSAAAWNGLTKQFRPRVLEQEPASTCPQGAMHVLIEVEGSDDHHREGFIDIGPGDLAGRLNPVDARHPDVEQTDVGTELAGEFHRLTAICRLADDLDVRLGVEDHRESGANDLLVVGDKNADHRDAPSVGNTAATVQPPCLCGPARRLPPSKLARSAIPTNP